MWRWMDRLEEHGLARSRSRAKASPGHGGLGGGHERSLVRRGARFDGPESANGNQ